MNRDFHSIRWRKRKPDQTWLYFALSQFPIYLSPQLLQPLARRVIGRTLQAGAEGPGGAKPDG